MNSAREHIMKGSVAVEDYQDIVEDVFANLTVTPDPVSDVVHNSTPYTPLDLRCNYYVKNETVIMPFENSYGGIPQNLLINLICWFVLLVLFALLRRSVGNFDRHALVRKDDDESKWTQLFFSPEAQDNAAGAEDASTSFDPNGIPIVEDVLVTEPTNLVHQDSMASIDYTGDVDNGFFSWVKSVFTLSDDKFMRKCGVDAVQYLKFQRHMILLVAIMTVVCLAVILPINIQGTLQGGEGQWSMSNDFGHTTISNLEGDNDLIWIHIAITILFTVLGVAIMRRFSVNLRLDEEQCISSRTLMIVGVPESYCTEEFLKRHFHEAYPTYEIDDVQVAHDVSKLCSLDRKRERARRARMYCENYRNKHGSGQQMRPFACGIVCCCGNRVDAFTFYKREEDNLTQALEAEKESTKTRSIGIAFVTFSNLDDARKVKEDHSVRCGGSSCFGPPVPTSTITNFISPSSWTVRFAPPPEDIYWENLNDAHRLFFFRALLINIFLFIVLFFFTSPTYIITQVEVFLNLKTLTNSGRINDFLPTLILWSLSALLPIMVAYSDWLMGHWRRSVENLWIMRKVFFFLLFMVLILPSIGLTTLRAFFESVIRHNKGENEFRWKCIFLPDNGAFFVNYVVTSALIGTALELMRFSELFVYGCRMLVARSAAETPSVRRSNIYEFMFGYNYGWMLLIFALTSAYAVVCPLITPFGLFYLVMKHLVDRYNLYFAYKRSKIDKNMHATAVNCVMACLILMQLILLFFNIVRASDKEIMNAKTIFSITMLSLFTVVFVGQMFFHMFNGISPLQYTVTSSSGRSRSGSADENADDFANQQRAGGPLSSMESETEADTDNILSHGGDLNALSNNRRRRRHKQFLPDVLRREHVVHQPLRPTGTNASRQQQQQQPRSPKGSPSRHYGTVSSSEQANTSSSNELFNDL